MPKKFLAIGLAAAVGVVLAAVQARRVEGRQQAPPITIQPVKDNLYNILGSGGNVAALVTNEGVILVDDKFEENHDAIMAALRTVTDQPVKYVLNTHYHADHAGGNARFLPIAEVISTANARTNILEARQPNAPRVAPARVVFTEEMSVFLGGQEARALHFGRGHTNTDAFVYFPGLGALHTGDMMAGTSPLIDYNGGGSLIEITKSLDQALNLEFDTVIPGHGMVTDKAGLRAYRDNIETMRSRVSELIRQGRTEEQVGEFMMSEYNWAPTGLQMQWSLPGMMVELR